MFHGTHFWTGERIEHTIVTHGDTIIDGDGVELGGITAHLLNLLTDYLTNLMEVGMTGHELCKRVHNGNNRLAKLFLFHTCGHPKGTGAGHSSTFCADCTSQLMFHILVKF